jgi:hypothetical protein
MPWEKRRRWLLFSIREDGGWKLQHRRAAGECRRPGFARDDVFSASYSFPARLIGPMTNTAVSSGMEAAGINVQGRGGA